MASGLAREARQATRGASDEDLYGQSADFEGDGLERSISPPDYVKLDRTGSTIFAMFSGKECSRAVSHLSFKPQDINGNLEGLDESELAIIYKYPKVGQLVP
ncbi:hypothetical protein MTR_6g027130 [Medicago truncatula]|uniref:Uncharacterized protein n=1 Tax=Medicago truncatula TaxID=3880 RepID=G7KPK1_MEDTR|nr:hypothetical protein MTR_6g027130 [Medicago truncatula]